MGGRRFDIDKPSHISVCVSASDQSGQSLHFGHSGPQWAEQWRHLPQSARLISGPPHSVIAYPLTHPDEDLGWFGE
jgi:hypothetical protein